MRNIGGGYDSVSVNILKYAFQVVLNVINNSLISDVFVFVPVFFVVPVDFAPFISCLCLCVYSAGKVFLFFLFCWSYFY